MKRKCTSESGLFGRRVLAGLGFCLAGSFLALAGLGQNESPSASSLPPVAHVSQPAEPFSARPSLPTLPGEADLAAVVAPATRSTFMARWASIPGAAGYRLDVSTSSSFSSYAIGYRDLDVGKTTGRVVTGLAKGTTYYYRVRAYGAFGTSGDSDVAAASTAPTGGLNINPIFESTILNDPNSVAIQATINQAISILEAQFSDSITVSILFRYTNIADPCGDVGTTFLGRSCTSIYTQTWAIYINALLSDARTANDATANASLPGSPLSTNIVVASANGRSVGLNTPGGLMFNGAGPYDATITLNPMQPLQFSRPPTPGNYDALRTVEHEIDEVLGLGAYANGGGTNLRVQDLFSWSSAGTRNLTTTGSRYFSINGGNTNIVGFNQTAGGDLGDWISPACPQPNPYVQNAFSCQGQFSDVTATSPEGINLDIVGYDPVSPGGTPSPTPTAPPSSTVLANISTRLAVGTGTNVLVGGFIVTGTQPKRIIVRAIGPSLPLAGVISDTVLELRNSTGGLIAVNDDWRTDQEAEIIATGIPPSNNLESAIVVTLPANNSAYTAIVSGYQGATGIGVVEAYDLDRTVNSKLANISTRGFVSTGDNVMIGGLIITGSNPTTVLLRAIGPSLINAGVANALSDTTLELHDGNGTVLAFNDDWRTDQEAAIIATGIPPANNLECAILGSFSPGNYTAVVRGYQNATGVALVEAYQLQ